MQAIKTYDVVDHGIDDPQNFNGCGTFPNFDHAFTGVGDNPYEAFDDALEQAAMTGHDVEHIPNDMPLSPSASDEGDKNYYVSIRVKLKRR